MEAINRANKWVKDLHMSSFILLCLVGYRNYDMVYSCKYVGEESLLGKFKKPVLNSDSSVDN